MYRVIIVDDEETVCTGLVRLINWESHGFTISDMAFDGQSALEKLTTNQYDLVITDIRMPVLGGIELLRELRKQNLKVKTIILSAYADFVYAQSAMSCGAQGYILKPINEEFLADTLDRIRRELDDDLPDPGFNDKTDISPASGELITVILHDLDMNYFTDISLISLSKRYFRTPLYLGKLFKQKTGKAFTDYLNDLRIEKSKQLLENPKYMIYEICERVGYKDINYFYKRFKIKTGVTPLGYREGILKKR